MVIYTIHSREAKNPGHVLRCRPFFISTTKQLCLAKTLKLNIISLKCSKFSSNRNYTKASLQDLEECRVFVFLPQPDGHVHSPKLPPSLHADLFPLTTSNEPGGVGMEGDFLRLHAKIYSSDTELYFFRVSHVYGKMSRYFTISTYIHI